MVQAYGAVSDNTTDLTGVGNSEETNSLLGRDRPTIAESEGKEGHATVFSCISNLLNTIIGSGESEVSLASLRTLRPKYFSFRDADLSFGENSMPHGCCPLVLNAGLGSGYGRNYPRNVDLYLFRGCWGVWVVLADTLRHEDATPSFLVPCRSAVNVPERSRFL